MEYWTFPHKRLLQLWHWALVLRAAGGNRIRAKTQVFQGPLTSFGGLPLVTIIIPFQHLKFKQINRQQCRIKKRKVTAISKSPEIMNLAHWSLFFHSFSVCMHLLYRNGVLTSLQTAFFTHCIHCSIPSNLINFLQGYLECLRLFCNMPASKFIWKTCCWWTFRLCTIFSMITNAIMIIFEVRQQVKWCARFLSVIFLKI